MGYGFRSCAKGRPNDKDRHRGCTHVAPRDRAVANKEPVKPECELDKKKHYEHCDRYPLAVLLAHDLHELWNHEKSVRGCKHREDIWPMNERRKRFAGHDVSLWSDLVQ